MASLEDRLKNNEYKLWVKAGICLGMVKTGLETFAEERSIRMHGFVTDKVKLVTPFCKTICPAAKIIKKRGGKWTTGCCGNCQIYVNELMGYQYAPFQFQQYNWTNSEVIKWPHEPWEMAKVYMNRGQKPFNQQPSPKETDLSGLINFIDHCVVPRTDIRDINNLIQVRDARNKVMHSATMKLTQDEFDHHIDAMIKLLEDPMVLNKTEEAKNAAIEIKRVQMVHFHISTTAELEVLRNKTTEIEAQGKHLIEELKQLRDKQEILESSTEEKIKSIRGLIERETGERENAIAALKKDISHKETCMKELTTDLHMVKQLMREDKDLYRKLNTRVKNVETTLEKTNVEFKVIQQSLGTLLKQVAKIQSDLNEGKTVNWNTDMDAAQLKENIVKLEVENEKLREQVEYRYEENEELKMKISSLEIQLATAQNQQTSETSQDDIKGLETVDALHITLYRMKKEAAENKKEYEDKIEKLEYQNHKLKNKPVVGQIKELEENLVDLESVLNESRVETETTYSHLKTYQSLYQQEKDNNKALKFDIERLKLDIISVEATMNRERKQFEMQIKNIIHTKEDVEHILKHKEDMVANLITECKDCRKTEKDMQVQQDQLTSDLHGERKRIIELEKTIEQLNHNFIKHKEDSEYTSRELLNKIANQEQDIDKKTQYIDRQKEDLDRRKQDLDRQKQDVDLQTQGIDRHTQELERQEQKLDAQKQDLDRQKQELDNQKQGFEAQKHDLDRKKKELYRHKQELHAQKQELDRQKQGSDRQKQILDAQKHDLNRLKLGLDRRKQKLDAQKQELDAQKQELHRQEQELYRRKQKLDAQKHDLDLQKQGLDRRKQKFDAQKQELDAQKQDLDRQKQDSDRQKKNLDTPKHDLDRQKHGLDRRQQKIDALKQELDHQKQNLYRQKLELDQRKQKLDAQKHDLDRQKQGLNRRKQKLDAHKQELNAQEQELDAQKSDLDGQKEGLDAKQRKIDAQKQELDSNKQDLDRQKQNLDRQEQELHDQKQDLDRQKQELYAQVGQLSTEVTKDRQTQDRQQQEFDAQQQELDTQEQQGQDAITREVNIKLPDDQTVSVSGATFLSGGELVVCDYNNRKVKLLSRSFDTIRNLDLHYEPWDVSEVGENNAVVTLPGVNEIRYIQVLPTLRETRVLKLDRKCFGIDMVKDEMYVTYTSPLLEGRGGVMILDKDGYVKRYIDIKTEDALLDYSYLLVAEAGRIYVSDYATNSVMCIDSKSQILHQYKDTDLRRPSGVYFDSKGQVIICGTRSDNLHIMTADGSKVKTVSTPRRPQAVAFRKTDRTLIIGSVGNSELLVLYNFTS